MNKIYKLFINENIKTWKKFSTKLAIVLCILSLIGVLAISLYIKYANERMVIEYADNNNWREAVKEKINEYNQELLSESLEPEDRKKIEARIEIREINLQYNIKWSLSYWKSIILNTMVTEGKIDKDLIELVKNNDFQGYIEIQKDDKKQQLDNKEITQEEYNDELEILKLRAKYEIGKSVTNDYDYDWREIVISNIQNMKKSIRTGINVLTNKVLTVEEKKEYEEKIKIYIYQIENNIIPTECVDTGSSYRMIFEKLAPSFISAVIALFAIIIAGGAISTETSTGTIKFWALTPNKRWKILTAKVLSLLFYIIIITMLMAVLTIICGNVFFDTPGSQYLYVKNGNVEILGNTLFIIVYYFAKIIPVVVFAILALMLSVVTRNSSVAISVSLGTYLGNSVVMSILNLYIKKDWVRFIPFNNLNIVNKIFPNLESTIITSNNFVTSTSLGFSLSVLAVCVVLMMVTTYDSFNNRDIT